MSWMADEWKEGLPHKALQKINQIETQFEKLKKERDQKNFQMESLEQAFQLQKRKVDDEKSLNADLRRETQSMAERCQEVEVKRQKIAQELHTKENLISCLNGQLSHSKSALEVETQKIQQLQQDLEKATHEQRESEKKFDKITADHQKLQEYCNHQKKQLDQQANKVKALELEIKKNSASCVVANRNTLSSSTQTDMVSDNKEKEDTLKRLLQDKSEELDNIKGKQNSLELKFEEVSKNYNLLKDQASQSQNNVKNKDEEMRLLKENITKYENKLDQMTKSHKEEKLQVEKMCMDIKTKLDQALSALEVKSNQLECEICKSVEKDNKLQVFADKLTKSEKEFNEMKQQLIKFEEHSVETKKIIASKDDEITQQKQKVHNYELKLDELAHSDSVKLKTLQDECNDMRVKCEQASSSLIDKSSHCEGLALELAIKIKEIEELMKRKQAIETEFLDLKSSGGIVLEQLRNAQTMIETKDLEVIKLQEQIRKYEAELDTSHKDHSNLVISLQEECSSLKCKLEQVSLSLTSKSSDLLSEHSKAEEKDKELHILSEKLLTTEEELAQVKIKNEEFQEVVLNSDNLVKTKDQTITDLKVSLGNYECQLDEVNKTLEEKIQILTAENSNLKSQVEQATASDAFKSTEIQSQGFAIEKKEQELQTISEKLSALEMELEKMESQNQELRKNYENNQDSITNRDKEISQLKDKIFEYEIQLDENNKSGTEKINSLQDMISDLKAKLEQVTQCLADKTSDFDLLLTSASVKDKDLLSLSENLSSLESENKELRSEKGALEDESEKSKNIISNKDTEIIQLRESVCKYEIQLDEEIKNHKNKLETFEGMCVELKGKLEQVTQCLADKTAELDALVSSSLGKDKELQNLSEKNSVLESENNTLKSDQQAFEDSSKNSQNVISNKDHELRQLKESVSKYETQLDEMTKTSENKLETLENMCTELKGRHEQVTQCLADKTAELDSLVSATSGKDEELQSLSEKYSVLESECKELKSGNKILQDLSQNSQNIISDKDEEIAKLKNLISKYETQLDEAMKNNSDEEKKSQSKIIDLQTKLEQATVSSKDKSAQLELQNSKINEKETESQTLSEKLTVVELEFEEMKATVSCLRVQCKHSEDLLVNKDKELEQLHKCVLEYEQQLDEMNKSHFDKVTVWEQETNKLKTSLQQASDSYASKTKELSLMQLTLEEKTNELEIISKRLAVAESEINAISTKHSDLNTISDNLNHIVSVKDEEIIQLRESLSKYQCQLDELNETHSKKTKSSEEEFIVISTKLEQITQCLADKTLELETYISASAEKDKELQLISETLAAQDSENKKLKSDFEEINGTCQNSQNILFSKEQEIMQLKHSIDEYENQLDELTENNCEKLKTLTEENSNLKSKFEQMTMSLDAKSSELHAYVSENASKDKQLQVYIDKLVIAEEEATNLKKRNEDLLKATEDASSVVTSKEQELVGIRQTLEEYEIQLDNANQKYTNSLTDSEKKIDELETKLQQASASIETKMAELLNYQLQVDNKEKEIESLSQELTTLHSENDELKFTTHAIENQSKNNQDLILQKEQQTTRLMESLEKYENELDEVNKSYMAKVTLLENECDSLKAKLEQASQSFNNKSAELDSIKNKLEDMEREYNQLKARVELLQMDLDDKDECIGSLNNMVENMKRTSSEVMEKYDQLQTKYTNITQLYESTSHKNDELNLELKSANEKMSLSGVKMDNMVEELQNKLTKYEETISQMQVEQKLQTETLLNDEHIIREKDMEINSLLTKLNNIDQQMADLKISFSGSGDLLASNTKEMEELRKSLVDITQDRNELKQIKVCLQGDVEVYENKISLLSETIQGKEHQIKQLEGVIVESEKEIKMLKDDLISSDAKGKELCDIIKNEHQISSDNLRSKIDEIVLQKEELSTQIIEKDNFSSELQQQLASVEEQLSITQKTSLDNEQSYEKDLSRLSDKLHEAEKIIFEKKEEVLKLEDKLCNNEEEKKNNIQNIHEELKLERVKAKDRESELENVVTLLKNKIAETDEMCKHIQQQSDECKLQLEAKISDFNIEREELKVQIHSCDAEKTQNNFSNEQKIDGLVMIKENLEETLKNKDSELCSLRNQLEELGNRKDSMKLQMEEETSTLKQMVCKLESDECSVLEKMSTTEAELRNVQNELEALKAKLEESQQKLKETTLTVSELEHNQIEKESEIDALALEKVELLSKINLLEADKEDLAQKLYSLNNEITSMKTMKNSFENKVEQAEFELVTSQTSSQNLQKQYDELRICYNNADEHIRKIEREKEELKLSMNKLNDDLKEASEKMEEKQLLHDESLEKISLQCDSLQQQLDLSHKVLEESTLEKLKLVDRLKEVEDDLQCKIYDSNILNDQNEKLTNQLSDLKDKFSKKDKENDKYQAILAFEQKISEVTFLNDELQQQVEKKQVEMDILKAEKDKFIAEREQLKKDFGCEIIQLKQCISNLEASDMYKNETSEQQQSEVNGLKKELCESNLKLEKTCEDLGESNESLNKYRNELSEKSHELDSVKCERNTLLERLDVFEAEKFKLLEKISDISIEVNRFKDTERTLQQELSQKEHELQSVMHSSQNIQIKNDEISQTLIDNYELIEKLKAENNNMKQTVYKMEGDIECLQEQLSEKDKEQTTVVENLTGRVDKLLVELQNSESQRHTSLSENQQQENKIKELESDISYKSHECETLMEKNEKCLEEIENLKEKFISINDDNRNKQNIFLFEEEINSLKHTSSILENCLGKKEKEIELLKLELTNACDLKNKETKVIQEEVYALKKLIKDFEADACLHVDRVEQLQLEKNNLQHELSNAQSKLEEIREKLSDSEHNLMKYKTELSHKNEDLRILEKEKEEICVKLETLTNDKQKLIIVNDEFNKELNDNKITRMKLEKQVSEVECELLCTQTFSQNTQLQYEEKNNCSNELKDRIQKLENEKSEVEIQLQRKVEVYEGLKKDLEEKDNASILASKHLEEVKNQLSLANSNLEEVSIQTSHLQSRVNQLETECASIEDKKKCADSQLERLSSDCEQTVKKLAETEERLQEAIKDREALDRQFNTLKTSFEHIEAQKNEILCDLGDQQMKNSDNQSDINDLTDEIEKLKSDLVSQQIKGKELESIAEDTENKNIDLLSQLDDLRLSLAEQTSSVHCFQEKLKTSQQELMLVTNGKKEFEERMQIIMSEVDALVMEKQDLEERLRTVIHTSKDEHAEVERLNVIIKDKICQQDIIDKQCQTYLCTINEQSSQIESFRIQLEQVEKDLKKEKSHVYEYKMRQERSDHERENLEMSLAEANSTKSDLENKVQSMEEEVREIKSSSEKLQMVLVENEKYKKKCKVEVEQSKYDLTLIEKEKENLEEQLREHKEEVTHLKKTIDTLMKEKSDSENVLDNFKDAMESIEMDLSATVTEKANLMSELSELKKGKEILQCDLRRSKEENNAMNEKLKVNENLIEELHIKLDNQNQKASERINIFNTEIIEMQEKYSKVCKAENTVRDENKHLRDKILKIESSNIVLHQESTSLSSELKDVQNKLSSFEAEEKKLKNQLETQEKEKNDLLLKFMSLEDEKAKLEKSNKTLKDSLNYHQQQMTRMENDVEKHQLKHESEIKSLKTKFVEKENSCKEIISELDAKACAFNELKSNYDKDIENMKQQLQQKEECLEDIQQKLKTFESNAEEGCNIVTNLQADHDALKKENAELKSKWEELKDKVIMRNRQIGAILQQKAEALENHSKVVSEKDEEIEILKKKLNMKGTSSSDSSKVETKSSEHNLNIKCPKATSSILRSPQTGGVDSHANGNCVKSRSTSHKLQASPSVRQKNKDQHLIITNSRKVDSSLASQTGGVVDSRVNENSVKKEGLVSDKKTDKKDNHSTSNSQKAGSLVTVSSSSLPGSRLVRASSNIALKKLQSTDQTNAVKANQTNKTEDSLKDSSKDSSKVNQTCKTEDSSLGASRQTANKRKLRSPMVNTRKKSRTDLYESETQSESTNKANTVQTDSKKSKLQFPVVTTAVRNQLGSQRITRSKGNLAGPSGSESVSSALSTITNSPQKKIMSSGIIESKTDSKQTAGGSESRFGAAQRCLRLKKSPEAKSLRRAKKQAAEDAPEEKPDCKVS